MKIAKLSSFLSTLQISEDELNNITKNIDNHYYSFSKYGRIFQPSTKKLKKLQKLILTRILEKIKLPKNIHGGLKGHNSIDSALEHLGKKYHFCTDIKKFFPSIRHHDVFRMFLNNGFSPDVSNILTKLTTYKGELPQGIPTSTYISNLVFLEYDKKIINLCNRHNIIYTRWVDDLVLSSQSDFKHLTFKVLEIIESNHLRRSHKKTFYKAGPIEILGIVVKQNSLGIPNDKVMKFNNETNPNKKKGQVNYFKQVDKRNKKEANKIKINY